MNIFFTGQILPLDIWSSFSENCACETDSMFATQMSVSPRVSKGESLCKINQKQKVKASLLSLFKANEMFKVNSDWKRRKISFSGLFPSQWSCMWLVSEKISSTFPFEIFDLPFASASRTWWPNRQRQVKRWHVPSWLGPRRAQTCPGKHRRRIQSGSARAPRSTAWGHTHARSRTLALSHSGALRHERGRPPAHLLWHPATHVPAHTHHLSRSPSRAQSRT